MTEIRLGLGKKIRNYGLLLAYGLFKNYINDGPEGFTLTDLCLNFVSNQNRTGGKSDTECCHDALKCTKCNKSFS